nr:MAG TPA: hypothetical protein [Caudoviricetes sp.]
MLYECKEAKQNFIILELYCTYGNTKQQRITPLYLLSEGNTPYVFMHVCQNSLHLQL